MEQERNTLPRRNYVGGAHARTATPEAIDRIAAGAYVYVCCVNDMADNALRDAVSLVRNTRYWRQTVKRECNAAIAASDSYQRRLASVLNRSGKNGFWCDLADGYQEKMQPHIDRLVWAIRQRMLDLKVPSEDQPVFSAVMAADVMLSLASENFDAYFENQRERTGADVSPWFAKASLAPAKLHFHRVADVLLRDRNGKDGRVIDFGEDSRCSLALKCIETQMLSDDIINSVGDGALKLHPEFISEGA